MGALFFLSPLRYPGGKGRLTKFLGALLADQPAAPHTYVEPFAGGAGAALQLLYGEYVEQVVLNDLDPRIAALWRAIFNQPDAFVREIERTPVTIKEWHRQRVLFETDGLDDLQAGFAAFYMNRTNRSGILKAGPIGGMSQAGNWKIDARFGKPDLIKRVKILGHYRNRVTLLERDGVEVAADYLNKPGCFVYADPPYLGKGGGLYMNQMDWADHQRLATALRAHPQGSWMLTYDCDLRVPTELYAGLRCVEFSIAHTAAVQHVGREYAVFSHGVRLDLIDELGAHGDYRTVTASA